MHYMNMFLPKQFLRKLLSLYFNFLSNKFKQILGLEHKRLSSYRLLVKFELKWIIAILVVLIIVIVITCQSCQ